MAFKRISDEENFYLTNLRVHDGLEFTVELPAMPALQVVVIRLAILHLPGFHVILLVPAPPGVLDDVLVDRADGLVALLLHRFDLVASQLKQRLEGRLAFVGQVVRDTPVHALRENVVVRRQSVHREAKRDLRITTLRIAGEYPDSSVDGNNSRGE